MYIIEEFFLESCCLKVISYLDSFFFLILLGKGIFRKRYSCVFFKDVVYCLRGVGFWRLFGALVEKEEVFVLVE